jgi:Flp pilus assembly protein TadG
MEGWMKLGRNAPGRERRAWAGASVVELALLSPLLALIVIGTVDLGRAFIYYERLTSAVREGAIYGTYVTDSAAITQRAYTETNGQLGTTGVDFIVDPSTDVKFYAGATTTPRTGKFQSGDSVEVTGHYRFRPLTSMLVRILPANFTVRKSVRMVIN